MGISELTALELGKEIKEKRISVREAVQASLERIHKYEDTVIRIAQKMCFEKPFSVFYIQFFNFL